MGEVSTLRPDPLHTLSIEAEQQLLGGILTNNDTFNMVADFLRPEHFSDPVHQRIYEHCVARISKAHLVSPVTLKLALDQDAGLAQLGGPGYLVRLAGASIGAASMPHYARMIVEAAARRALNGASQEAIQRVLAGEDASEVKIALLQALYALPEAKGQETSISFLKAITEAADQAVQTYQGAVSFLKTGMPTLDAIIKGLAPGDYCLIAGATSMGKTSVMLDIARSVALEQGKGVALVSLEMSPNDLATRMASAKSRVPYSNIRSADQMEEADFRKWIEATAAIAQAPIKIVPKHVRDISAIHSAVTKIKNEMSGSTPLSCLMVDYAQLVRGPGKDRYQQMTEVSIGLKLMAGMLEVPLIALCQLSRAIAEREDKRPQLSDIRETGQFEQDADQVIFCHREEYYMRRGGGPVRGKNGSISVEAQADWEAQLRKVTNVMELIVRKNRHGRLATAEMGFHDATNRFWTLGDGYTQDAF